MIRAVFSMMALQAFGYVFPFATLIIVSRFLPQEGLAQFLYLQAAAALLAITVEYGYHLSAVRIMTQALVDKTERKAVSEIHATRAMLFGSMVLVSGVLLAHNDVVPFSWPALAGLAAAVFSYGFRPLWYYQATDQYRVALLTDLAGNVASFGLVLAASLMRLDAAWTTVCWALPRASTTGLLVLLIHRRHGIEHTPWPAVWQSLQRSFLLFVHKLAAGCVHLATPVLLGYLVTRESLLDYQKAERLMTATQSLLLVISQVGYARVLKALGNAGQGQQEAWRVTLWQLGAGLIGSVLLYMLGPVLLKIFWGHDTPETLQTLRWLCWMLPLLALNAALGLNFLLPRHQDRVVVGAAAIGAIGTLMALFMWSGSLQHLGGVAGIAIGEGLMTVVMLWGLRQTQKVAQA